MVNGYIILGVTIFIVGLFLLLNVFIPEKETKYQGPVPQGYDEKHFRETGKTIKLEEDKPYGEFFAPLSATNNYATTSSHK